MDRLETILSFIPSECTPVEIGADRAPVALGFAKVTGRTCYASEVSKGPYEALITSVRDAGMSHLVKTYMADGLDNLPLDVDTAIICGMGGFTIERILDKAETRGLKLLVLEPQSHPERVRHKLLEKHFFPYREQYVIESGRIYPVIAARQRGKEKDLDEVEMLFGRYPLQNRDPLLRELLMRLAQIYRALDESVRQQKKGFMEALIKAFHYF